MIRIPTRPQSGPGDRARLRPPWIETLATMAGGGVMLAVGLWFGSGLWGSGERAAEALFATPIVLGAWLIGDAVYAVIRRPVKRFSSRFRDDRDDKKNV